MLDGVAEVIERMRTQHMATITEVNREILTALIAGQDDGAIAKAAFLERRTVEEHRRSVRANVCAALGVESSSVVLGAWGILHLRCCLGQVPA